MIIIFATKSYAADNDMDMDTKMTDVRPKDIVDQLVMFVKNNRQVCDNLSQETIRILENLSHLNVLIEQHNSLESESNEQVMIISNEFKNQINLLNDLITDHNIHSQDCSDMLVSAYDLVNKRIQSVPKKKRKDLLRTIQGEFISGKWFVESNAIIFNRVISDIKENQNDFNKIIELISSLKQVIILGRHDDKIDNALNVIQQLILLDFKEEVAELFKEECNDLLSGKEEFPTESDEERIKHFKQLFDFMEKTNQLIKALSPEIESIERSFVSISNANNVKRESWNQLNNEVDSCQENVKNCIIRLETIIEWIDYRLPFLVNDVKQVVDDVHLDSEVALNMMLIGGLQDDVKVLKQNLKSIDTNALKYEGDQRSFESYQKLEDIQTIITEIKNQVKEIEIDKAVESVKKLI